MQDVANEYKVQNTAKIIMGSGQNVSNIDKNPGRYEIIGTLPEASRIFETGKIYEKDPEAYYPNPPKDTRNAFGPERGISPLTPRQPVYNLDPKPYYSPTPNIRVVNDEELNKGKPVPVLLGDVSETFPSEQNLLKLKRRLKELMDSLKVQDYGRGINKVDPRAYYDPTTEDTLNSIRMLEDRIICMEHKLNEAIKNDVQLELQKSKVTPQIQNFLNMNAEMQNKAVKENYYTPIGVHKKKKYHVEFPVGTKFNELRRPDSKSPQEIVDADEEEHDLQDAEENEQSELIEADEKQSVDRKARRRNFRNRKMR